MAGMAAIEIAEKACVMLNVVTREWFGMSASF